MKKEKKQKVHYLSKDAYLLGRRKSDNSKVYLEAGSWDCGWYWGFGYLEVYNKPKTDINEHYHFNSLFNKFGIDGIEEHFSSFVLLEKEIWILADLMKSYYNLREVADFYHQGNSNFTSEERTRHNGISRKNLNMYKIINADIGDIIKQVKELLIKS